MKPSRRAPLLLGIAAAVVLASCGSGSTAPKVITVPAGQQPSNTSDGSAPVPQKLALPAVEVLDTANDEKVQFASLLPAEKPVLFWFWAPH